MATTTAWLFEILPQKDNVLTYWVTNEQKTITCFLPQVFCSIYAVSTNNTSLESLYANLLSHPSITSVGPAKKRISIHDKHYSTVLEIKIPLYINKQQFIREIRDLFPLSLYNIDLSNFQYLYAITGLFPFCKAQLTIDSRKNITKFEIVDELTAFNYELPPVKAVQLDIEFTSAIKKDKLRAVTFTTLSSTLTDQTDKKFTISSLPEQELIYETMKLLTNIDPDVLVTHGGDQDLRLFALRAVFYGMGDLSFSRQPHIDPLYRAAAYLPKGTSFMSYGGHFYKDHGYYLYGGRHHVDLRNSFTWKDGGFAGIVELARLSCIDAQRCARTSIGTNLTGMQIRQALMWDILIPSRKADVERFRSGETLVVGDRGGFIFSPRVGLHFNVAGIDFSSMFPQLMVSKNISPETVNCKCCANGTGRPIPGTSWYTCQERKGLVPLVLKTVLEKRLFYKQFRKVNKSYDQLQKTLKWILVTCFEENTLLPVYENNKLKLVRIGKFVDNLIASDRKVKDISVVGLDKSFKAILNPIKQIFKLPSPKTLFRFQLETGRELTVTGDHTCFILSGNALHEIKAKDVRVGNFFPFLNSMPAINVQTSINAIPILIKTSIEEDLDKWRVWGDSLLDYIRFNEEKLRRNIIGYHSHGAIRSWLLEGFIPLRYLELLNIPEQEFTHFKISYGRRVGGKLNWLPAKYEIDKELAFFLGYFIGDGSARNTFLRLAIHEDDTDLIEWFQFFASTRLNLNFSVRKEPHTKMYTIQLNSAGFSRILTSVLGVEHTADLGKLRVPEIILNGHNSIVYWFFGGMIASDGNVHPNRNVIRITSASFSFVEELSYLATRIGLYHTIQQDQSEIEDGCELWNLILSGTDTINKLLEYSYIKKFDTKKIDTKNLEKNSRSYGLDVPIFKTDLVEIAKKLKKTREPRITQRERVPREVLKTKLSQLYELKEKLDDKDRKKLQTIENLTNSDIGFVKVISISEVSATSEYVYCLEVANQLPGFFAGKGGIFTHNCFGYQGYRNARFGRIEAHEAINAYARESLLVAGEIFQKHNFELVAGIVDSLWGKYVDEKSVDSNLIEQICHEIEEKTELPISHEGTFRWIVFLPRRHEPEVGVLNRYYGCFDTGDFKVRGIEIRRRDTCDFIRTAQNAALEVLAPATSKEEFFHIITTDFWKVHEKFDSLLIKRDVPPDQLFIKKVIAKEPHQYVQAVHQAIAAQQLAKAGRSLQSGMKITFLVTNSTAKSTAKRVIAKELYNGEFYDLTWYRKMLREAFVNIIPPLYPDRKRSSLSLNDFITENQFIPDYKFK
jgi:DNA polymerase elongation subunit (family B)